MKHILFSSLLRKVLSLILLCAAANSAWGGQNTVYQHVFSAKPSLGETSLSDVAWTIEATSLGSYNSANYAGVQFGTSKKNGSITLTSISDWNYNSLSEIKEVRLWLNTGGSTVTPTVTIGGVAATSDGTTVTKNSGAGSDWTKATKVTFTPGTNGNTGIVVVDIQSVAAGYICAMEIECIDNSTGVSAPTFDIPGGTYTEAQTIKISNYDNAYTYVYTTDGNDPAIDADGNITTGILYDNNTGISVTATTTVKAIACNAEHVASAPSSATYTIEKSIANTAETAYTVAEAVALIDANSTQLANTEVYVKGIVSKIVTAWNDTYKNATYDISEDGSTTGQQFQLFRCATDGAKVGDFVIAKGLLTLYGSTYEFKASNVIESILTAPSFSIENMQVQTGSTQINPTVTTNVTGEYTVTYVSDNETVVKVMQDGSLAATETPGTANITATLKANGYMEATTEFSITVLPNATLKSIEIGGTLTKSEYIVGETFDFSGLTATGIYSNNSTIDLTDIITWSTSTPTLNVAGQNISVSVTATLQEGETTISNSKDIIVNVNKKNLTIIASDISLTRYATNVTPFTTDPEIEIDDNWQLTLMDNSGIIKIDENGKTISAVNVGDGETLKISFVGNSEYNEATASITVNVEPYAFKETFDNCNGTGGCDGKWNGSIANSKFNADNNWTTENAYGAYKCAKFGTGNNKGTATTPEIPIKSGMAKLSFGAGAWDATNENTNLLLSMTNGTLSEYTITLPKGMWKGYVAYISGVTDATQITIAAENASNNRFFLDNVTVEPLDIILERNTATGSYGTICLKKPAIAEGAEIYSVDPVGSTETNIKLTPVENNIMMAGVPYIYKATADVQKFYSTSYYNLDIESEQSADYLTGSFTEIQVVKEANNYILKNNKFYYVDSDNVYIGANHAYLTMPATSAEARPMVITIEDDGTVTGIDNISNAAKSESNSEMYDLAGRRVSKATSGVYIVGGKKIIR